MKISHKSRCSIEAALSRFLSGYLGSPDPIGTENVRLRRIRRGESDDAASALSSTRISYASPRAHGCGSAEAAAAIEGQP
ncbi:MAG: hypothetical protein AB1442_02180 [Nitrospirota bacterium]